MELSFFLLSNFSRWIVTQIVCYDFRKGNLPLDQFSQLAQLSQLVQLFQVSDFVLVTCAFSPELHHLFNTKTFDMMKTSSILINTSRGGIINQVSLYTYMAIERSCMYMKNRTSVEEVIWLSIFQDDLVTALKEGKIFAAGLDVMTPEPLPTDHPLTQLNNCVLVSSCFALLFQLCISCSPLPRPHPTGS